MVAATTTTVTAYNTILVATSIVPRTGTTITKTSYVSVTVLNTSTFFSTVQTVVQSTIFVASTSTKTTFPPADNDGGKRSLPTSDTLISSPRELALSSGESVNDQYLGKRGQIIISGSKPSYATSCSNLQKVNPSITDIHHTSSARADAFDSTVCRRVPVLRN